MEKWSREEWEATSRQSEKTLFYLYTPICGTCAVATKMMNVVATMKPDLSIGKADLNYVQDIAKDYEIERVPCLLITEEGVIREKIYAFQSVPDLIKKIG